MLIRLLMRCRDQHLLFPAGQLLNGIFPAHRFFLCGKAFHMNQLYRPAAFGIFRALSLIMGLNPFLKMIGPSRIQTSVSAFYYIYVIFLILLFDLLNLLHLLDSLHLLRLLRLSILFYLFLLIQLFPLPGSKYVGEPSAFYSRQSPILLKAIDETGTLFSCRSDRPENPLLSAHGTAISVVHGNSPLNAQKLHLLPLRLYCPGILAQAARKHSAKQCRTKRYRSRTTASEASIAYLIFHFVYSVL